MLNEEIQLKRLLGDLFRVQLFASLATLQGGRPYNSLIAFAATDDLKSILFVTKRQTRKYTNILSNNSVSVLIDSRSNRDSDVRNAVAVTAIGTAAEVTGDQKQKLLGIYLAKHHSLEKFAHLPESALFRIDVKRYFIVRNFQDVVELKIEG
jgi:nitroimidazol reductase NimA-like FMN-containing flavoprotein (pyridoxamine 5'-phosphate oxidase superfamily)